MSDRAEVVIVGGGLEGLSVAWALTRRGLTDVVVLERGAIGSGFTSKSSGIIRCHYGVRSIAAMAWRSLEVLGDAPNRLNADIGFRQIGYLVGVGPENVEPLEANVATQQSLGIEVELLAAEAVTELFPHLRIDDYAAFAYEPRGGYADAYQTAQAFGSAAREAGARVRQSCPVASISTKGGQVNAVVLADGERVDVPTVVVAAGPWSPRLVAPLGIDLPMKTLWEELLIIDPGTPVGTVPVLSDLVSLQYVRKEGPDHLLVGNSNHEHPRWVDPDSHPSVVTDEYLLDAVEHIQHRFPAFTSASLVSSYTGCYDVLPDFNPVIGPSPVDGLYLCAGFAGHGYKISPAVGELIADIILDGDSSDADIPARDFRFERFAEGDLLRSPHPYVGAGQMR